MPPYEQHFLSQSAPEWPPTLYIQQASIASTNTYEYFSMLDPQDGDMNNIDKAMGLTQSG